MLFTPCLKDWNNIIIEIYTKYYLYNNGKLIADDPQNYMYKFFKYMTHIYRCTKDNLSEDIIKDISKQIEENKEVLLRNKYFYFMPTDDVADCICPNPDKWNDIYLKLKKTYQELYQKESDELNSLTPLILAAWINTDDYTKMQRWLQTVKFAKENDLIDYIKLNDKEKYRGEGNFKVNTNYESLNYIVK